MAKEKKSDITQVAKAPQSNDFYDNPRLLLFACMVCTLAIYISSDLRNQFAWDDSVYVTGNTVIQTWNSGIFTAQVNGNWAPVHIFLLALQYHLFGLHPAGYHLVSILLHLCNLALTFLVVLKLGRKLPVAAIVALFFGIHPMRVESVAWISAQKDLLYTGFYLAAILMYCNYKESTDSTYAKNKYLSLTLLFFILSCLSKAMGVTLPVVLILIDSFRADNWNWKFVLRNGVRKIIFFAVAIGFGALASLIQKKGGAIDNFTDHTFAEQLMFACYGLAVYVAKFIAPFAQCPFYLYPLKDSAGTYPIIFRLSPGIVALLAILIAWLLVWRKKKGMSNKVPLSGLLFFLANMVLVLQLKTVGFAMLAERYTYLSYFGLLFIAAETLHFIWEKYSNQSGKILMAAFGSLALIFGIATFRYAEVWKDDVTLWTHVIERYSKDSLQYFEFVYINRGSAYVEEGKPELAIIDFTQAITLKPQYADAYKNMGIAYVKQGKLDSAIRNFTQAISLKPGYSEVYMARGAAYRSQGKPDMAISDFTQVIAITPKDPEAYNSRGAAYTTEGKLDMALADFTKAISLAPADPQPYYNRGLVYVIKEKPDLAITDFTRAISLKPDYSEAFISRGTAYVKQGKLGLGISDFNHAIIIKPQAETYINRGAAYMKQGEPDQAIADFTQAIILTPHNTQAYINRGSAYASQGKPDEAIADFTKPMSFDTTNAEPFYNRGLIDARKGNPDAAIADFTRAITLNPKYAEAYSNRGVAYVKQKKLDAAIADFTRAIILKPQYPDPYSNRGVAYMNQRKLDRAIADYTSAIQLNPHYVEAYNNRGFTYLQQGKFDLAIADCSQAISLNPAYVDAYIYRGFAEKKKGDDASAQLDFQKAKSLTSMRKE